MSTENRAQSKANKSTAFFCFRLLLLCFRLLFFALPLLCKYKSNENVNVKKKTRKEKTLTRYGGGGLFFEHHFCGYPQHGHLRGFAKLIAAGQTIFVASRKWFSPHVLLGSTKRFAIFYPRKKSAGGLTSGAIWHIIMASCFSALLLC